ncbi:hypothetical protein CBL_08173 [Carabus blaptoides fortunei]
MVCNHFDEKGNGPVLTKPEVNYSQPLLLTPSSCAVTKIAVPCTTGRNQNLKELLKFYEFFTASCAHTYVPCYALTIQTWPPAGSAIYEAPLPSRFGLESQTVSPDVSPVMATGRDSV